ncbi:lipase/acyltransferase domain-containing protein [Brevibacillus choshinensis]|uniref:Pre-peptidase C-terminal domain-containing protein n=1 Tax=Brevibacillus choshinensis TaxID=54911 RepID=A0ABX7FP42_BRECH|nr:pre-peptidase C-terminal domain-containing protein [Brevibacillus choshinensis]QRG67437.1 pre-peptidase C-terminal domain-containing protein [Brevibacillus choshinensis]
MGKSVKRLALLILILTLLGCDFVTSAWAKEERQSLLKEAWAWVEGGELRIQASLQRSKDEPEFVVNQDDQELTHSIQEGARFSVAVKPVGKSPLTVGWRTDEDEPATRLQIRIPESVQLSADGIELKEVPWDLNPGQKEEQLHLVPLTSDEPLGSRTSEEGAQNKQQVQVERWAKDFYREYSPDKKPRETALRSRPATFELEPNDTVRKADWLFDAKDAYGKIGKSGDVDMWKIKATKNGTMNVSLRDIPRGQDYNFYVFSGDNQELGRAEKEGQADEAVDGITLEQGEWYYVKVQGNSDSFHKDYYYRLRADFVDVQGDAKLDEFEPNDSLDEAHSLGTDFDVTLQANLHGLSDIDIYQFGITLASTIRLDLKEISEGMDIDLYLLDQEGKVLSKSEKPKNANEQIAFAANPGTYLVKVVASQRSGFAPNTYKLEVATKTIPVILIPGIGGSRLEAEEDGKITEIWLGLGDSLIGINDPRHRRLLGLEPIRPNSTDVQSREKGVRIFPERADEGFRAIEYLSYSPLDPIRNTTEQYYSMVKQLEKMGYKKHRSLFAMPYDWRYSSTKNAVALKQKIDLALERSGASQVQLVAHSMGGLLVRETLLSNVSYQSKVNRIVYLGTPFIGAPRAYQAIRYGYNFSIPWMDEETGKVISEYAPAVYELLPSKKYFQTVGFLKKDKDEPYSYDEFMQDKAIRLSYTPLVKQAGKLHEKWDAKTIGVPQYSIIGQGQPTLLGYFYDHNHQAWTPYYDKGMGDGTVPYLSASYAQKDMKKKYYVMGEHAQLPKLPEVIAQVAHLLKGMEDTQPGLRHSSRKQQTYLTYILSRADGTFPDVTVVKSGKRLALKQQEKEGWEDLSVEYHGNLVVMHVKDGEELEFEDPNAEQGSTLQIQRFSSEDSDEEQETGKWYRLGQRGLQEAVDLGR